jgi:three-Cys-motif partner protein
LRGKLVFLFIDERPDRIAQLEQELATFSLPLHFSVKAEAGVFHEKLAAILDDLEAQSSHIAPTFAFIDPFGFKGIPFDLVKRLLRHPRTEIFVTFMVDPINRFIEHPNDQVVQHIIDVFGSSKVLGVARGPGDRVKALRMLYQRQLEQVAKFVRYFEMRDAKNRTIYYLFFATNHPLGHVKMKKAFWKVDSERGFQFSDATNPNQLVMFEMDPSPALAEILLQAYVSQTMGVEQIQCFVEEQTPFLATHMRSALKLLESKGQIMVKPLKRDGKKRRASTFPKDVIITFL